MKNVALRNIRNYLIALLCILQSQSLSGQSNFSEGYIIKNDNDTVFGLIKLQERAQHAKECVFIKDSDATPIEYLASGLTGYRFTDGKYYVSKDISYQLDSDKIEKIDDVIFDRVTGTFTLNDTVNVADSVINKKVFLEYLVDGNVDVYLYVDDAGKFLYFIQKEGDSLIYLENTYGVIYNQWNDDYIIEKKEYVGILNYVLQDCEGIESKVSNVRLTNESLIKLAEYYHDKTCSNPNELCIVYEKQNRKTQWSVIPLVNYSTLQVTASELNRDVEYNFINNTFSYGMSVKFSNFQYVNPHLFSQIAVILHNQSLQSEDFSTHIAFRVLEIPIEFNYSFLIKSKVKPYIGLSINPNYRIQTDFITSRYPDYLEAQTKSLYFTISGITGIEYYLNRNLFLTTALKYKVGGPFYNAGNIKDNSKSNTMAIQVGLGYLIK